MYDEPLDAESSNHTYVHWTKFLSAVFLSCCCVVGLYGNIMSVVVFSHSSMRSSINFLLAALSVTDIVLLISVFVVLIAPNFMVIYPTPWLSQIYPYTVLIFYPISTMTQTCSVWTFVLISFERYLAIVKPLQRHKLMTMNEAKFAQCMVFVCGISYNAIRFWEYKLEPTEADQNGTENNTDTDMEHYQLVAYLRQNPYYFLIYSTIMHLCTHFLFPFAIIVTSHFSVFRALRRARKQIRNARRSGGRNRGTTFMIMTLTLAFVLFNVLPLAGDLWEALDPNLYDGPWMKSGLAVSELSNCLSVLNSSCTFVIYLAYCRKYRRLFLRYSRIDPAIDGSPRSQNESLSTAFL